MRKFYIIAAISLLLFGMSACSREEADVSSVETQESQSSAVSEESKQQIFEGNELEFFEIELPADGEEVTYSPALMLYDDGNGHSLTVYSAARNEDTITFYTDEADYYFDPLGLTIITAAGEHFISLNPARDEDGACLPGVYEISVYTPVWSEDTTLESNLRDLKAFLGDAYDETKNYYCIEFHNVL